jgi:hypothetical protein
VIVTKVGIVPVGTLMKDKVFFGTILAMFVAFTGHPWIALFIFWLSVV